jgi:hypothetical protein
MKDIEEGVWRADMLERYPMDSNAMVSDLDGERRDLLLTYVEERTLSEEIRDMLAEVVRRHPRYLRVKETFETLEAYRRIGQDVYECWRDGFADTIYDLCAGHGLLGLLMAYRFPKLSVECIDAERRPAFGHYMDVAADVGIELDNIRYVESDLTDAEIVPHSYVICVHACNELTQIALEKADEADACYGVMPCCIRDGIYFERIKHADDATRYAAAVGFIGGLYGATKLTAIDERITNRNLIILRRPR